MSQMRKAEKLALVGEVVLLEIDAEALLAERRFFGKHPTTAGENVSHATRRPCARQNGVAHGYHGWKFVRINESELASRASHTVAVANDARPWIEHGRPLRESEVIITDSIDCDSQAEQNSGMSD